MGRFRRTNGITEAFHDKMERLRRQAYGFRCFNNYGMRVKLLCAGMDRDPAPAPISGEEP